MALPVFFYDLYERSTVDLVVVVEERDFEENPSVACQVLCTKERGSYIEKVGIRFGAGTPPRLIHPDASSVPSPPKKNDALPYLSLCTQIYIFKKKIYVQARPLKLQPTSDRAAGHDVNENL